MLKNNIIDYILNPFPVNDEIYEYVKEQQTFSIPEIQALFSVPYSVVRKVVTKLEASCSVCLLQDGLTYSRFNFAEERKIYEFDSYCIDEEEWKEKIKGFGISINKRVNKLLNSKEEKIRPENPEELEDPPKEYVWVLGQCVKDNKIDVSCLQKELFMAKSTILEAISWIKTSNYMVAGNEQKVWPNDELFLELYADYEPFVKPTTLIELDISFQDEEWIEDIIEQAELVLLNYISLNSKLTLKELKEYINKLGDTMKSGYVYKQVFEELCLKEPILNEEDFEVFKEKLLKKEEV